MMSTTSTTRGYTATRMIFHRGTATLLCCSVPHRSSEGCFRLDDVGNRWTLISVPMYHRSSSTFPDEGFLADPIVPSCPYLPAYLHVP